MVNILLMDDDVEFASVLTETLEHAGYRVTTVGAATEAIQVIKAERFDILITDLIVYDGGRPVADGGLTLISRLRGPTNNEFEPWVREMPIIAISGKIRYPGMTNMLRTAQSLGADITLGKPTDIETLLNSIRVLTKHQ